MGSYTTLHNAKRMPKTQYSTTNRVQEIEDRASNQNDYLRITEARMGREKQLRLETQRRRKKQKLRQKKMALQEQNQRERKLKERTQKKSDYVNYVRKHLTKVILRPNINRNKSSRQVRSTQRLSNNLNTTTSRPTSVASGNPSRTLTQQSQQRTARSNHQLNRVEFTRIPIRSNNFQEPSLKEKNTTNNDNSDNSESAGQLLKDLRNQMKRNEKLRCSIEALDLQVKIHTSNSVSSRLSNRSQKVLQVNEVPENSVFKNQEQDEHSCGSSSSSSSNNSDDDDASHTPSETIEEAIVGIYDEDSMDGTSVHNTSIERIEHDKENMTDSPSSSSKVSTSPLCSPKKSRRRRRPPPQAPPQSPSNQRVPSKSPTWLRNLDPAPT